LEGERKKKEFSWVGENARKGKRKNAVGGREGTITTSSGKGKKEKRVISSGLKPGDRP